MINKVKETYPNLHNRFAIVVYWDFDVNNSKTSVLNFTNNLDMLQEFLDNIKCLGGDDYAEDVLGGLKSSV